MKGTLVKVIAYDKFKPGVTLDTLRPHLRDEVSNVWRLWKAGIVRENYARADVNGVVIVFECASVDEAKRYIADFPLDEGRPDRMGLHRAGRAFAVGVSLRPLRRCRRAVRPNGPREGTMKHIHGLAIPTTLDDVCDPRRMALLVYDMQVGIRNQIETGNQIVAQVGRVLSAARASRACASSSRGICRCPRRGWG